MFLMTGKCQLELAQNVKCVRLVRSYGTAPTFWTWRTCLYFGLKMRKAYLQKNRFGWKQWKQVIVFTSCNIRLNIIKHV